MQCRDFREVADSYLSDELLVETNHDVIAHLEACGDCRRELTARRELRSTLRAGFANSPELQISDQFAASFRAHLYTTTLQRPTKSLTRGRAWLAIAAGLIVAFGLGVVGVRYRVRTPSDQRVATNSSTGEGTSTPIATNSNPQGDVAINKLASFAVGDHRNCAIEFRLPEAPIALEEAGRIYDRSYINLTETVREGLAGLAASATFVEAHSCIFEGRRFAHLVLKQNGHVVSLLITDPDGLETVARKQGETKIDEQVISCSLVQGYQVSCFQTARHAIFVVSDLSEGDNLNLARALAPAIYQHLYRAESIA